MGPDSEGDRLEHYRLGQKLGGGGMGEVFLATDLRLNRQVAIKFVTTDRADEGLTKRLLQEAQAVAALDHPGICPVYDGGRDADGRAYMVMPFLDGSTLASRLYTAPMSVPESLTTCLQIADALACAHAGGIVHRDLKPQNVMLTKSGQLKLLDFGLAKILPAADRSESAVDTATALTTRHVLMGTPGYMAPEQIQEQPVDGRADLFALGAILFECLTGRQAFAGTGYLDVLGKIVHGPVPSPAALRDDVPPPVDELCRKLLAKDPADRFQSAAEVVEAIRSLLPAAPASGTPFGQALRKTSGNRRRLAYAAAVAVVGIAGVLSVPGIVRRGPAAPNLDAARYYEKGTEALRDGAFLNAAVALEEAVRIAPDYAAANARLAEARAEIDDEQEAQKALVRVNRDRGALSTDDALRVDAVTALVLGDVDRAVKGYEDLTRRHPNDPGAWVDLGRAQERAGQLEDARASYEKAISQGRLPAAAYLRLGIVETAQGRRDAALKALSEAERLYQAASNKEGEAEVLLRRGGLLDSVGENEAAKTALERAASIAEAMGNQYQLVRARLHLSSVAASAGHFADAEALASKTVQAAFEARLQTTAAEGLIDLAIALITGRRFDDAEAHLRKAADVAQRNGARRTAARAATQLAYVQYTKGDAAEALKVLEPALTFFAAQKYRRYELKALSIASRAHQQLDHMAEAETLARRVLKEAELTRDDSQVSEAVGTLALQATLLGLLPEALQLRQRAEQIHRRQGEVVFLPYDLTNKAELLILLGRDTEAAAALAEVEEGIRKKVDVYVGRQRRVAYLHVLRAVVARKFRQVEQSFKQIAPGGTDTTAALAPALHAFALSGLGRTSLAPPPPAGMPPGVLREIAYWKAVTAVEAKRFDEAFATASDGMTAASAIHNDELLWRFAAVASVAAKAQGRAEEARARLSDAVQALARLRGRWGEATAAYVNRADLGNLMRAAGVQPVEAR